MIPYLAQFLNKRVIFLLYILWILYRMVIDFGMFTMSNRPNLFCKKCDFTNFTKLTEKQLR